MPNELNEAWSRLVTIVPVSGLVFSDDIKQEIKIDRVTFMSISRLQRIRKNIGLVKKVSELKKQSTFSTLLESDSIAVVYGVEKTPKDQEKTAIHEVKQALKILSSSQLTWSRRKSNALFSIGNRSPDGNKSISFNRDDGSYHFSTNIDGRFKKLVVDKRWVQHHKQLYFFQLLELKVSKKIKKKWLDLIWRAAILMGESQSSNIIHDAFLKNIIVLETLLVAPNEKIGEHINKRMAAFLDWTHQWEENRYPKIIERLYKIRGDYVHQGLYESITIEDLLLSDTIVLNAMSNIVKNIDVFNSQEKLVELTERLSAAQRLGLPVKKFRPKNLQFLEPKYSDKDFFTS